MLRSYEVSLGAHLPSGPIGRSDFLDKLEIGSRAIVANDGTGGTHRIIFASYLNENRDPDVAFDFSILKAIDSVQTELKAWLTMQPDQVFLDLTQRGARVDLYIEIELDEMPSELQFRSDLLFEIGKKGVGVRVVFVEC